MNLRLRPIHLLLILLILTLHIQAAASPSTRPLGKVAQISYVDLATTSDLDRMFARLRAEGYGTVILRLFQNEQDRYLSLGNPTQPRPTSGVYFPTRHAPLIEDILTPALALARAYDLQLFGWLGTRRADWISSTHPWKDTQTNRLSLYQYEAINYLASLYSDLALSGVDGILIQDDLIYRTHDELPQGLLVRNTQGYTPEYTQLALQRSRVITNTLDSLIGAVHHHRPDCRILLNIYYEHGTNPEHALMWLAQDLELLAQLPIERFSIMSYHRQIGEELGLSREASIFQAALVVENIARAVGYDRIMPKIQTEDFRTGETIALEEQRALERLLPPGIPVAYMPVTREP